MVINALSYGIYTANIYVHIQGKIQKTFVFLSVLGEDLHTQILEKDRFVMEEASIIFVCPCHNSSNGKNGEKKN